MFEKVSLRFKLAFGFMAIGIISIILVTILSFISTNNLLITQSFNSLSSITQTKKQLVENYFKEIKDQIVVFSSDPSLIEASKDFFSAFSATFAAGSITKIPTPAFLKY